jgi:hypothetical protein
MLETLDTIDWSSLHHAYGEASDVPGFLRALLSEDEEEREIALNRDLFHTIWHQGTIYEASAYAVPFLFELLQAPQTSDKASIAYLLALLADGSSYLDDTRNRPKQEKWWRDYLASEGRDFETELATELSWVQATRNAVGEKLEAHL